MYRVWPSFKRASFVYGTKQTILMKLRLFILSDQTLLDDVSVDWFEDKSILLLLMYVFMEIKLKQFWRETLKMMVIEGLRIPGNSSSCSNASRWTLFINCQILFPINFQPQKIKLGTAMHRLRRAIKAAIGGLCCKTVFGKNDLKGPPKTWLMGMLKWANGYLCWWPK